ncbi:MAG: hypothetical protein HY814_10880, partial [Candidatus Riflebacteria bacterium]|nr:hypothetical protein [Candidatus Riflebacteria bacterium]
MDPTILDPKPVAATRDDAAAGLPVPSRTWWAWPAGLTLAGIVFYWQVLFGGQTFFFFNTLWFYYPDAVVTASAWKAGELPLWEPLITLGYPFQADPHSAVFYPFTALLLLLPFPRAYNVFVVAHVVFAGVFVYALLVRWQLSRASAAFGAAVLMFCGFTASSASDLTTLLRGLTWTPLALLAFDGFLAGCGTRAVLVTALVLAAQGSGTDPQYVLFTGGWLLAAHWLRPRPAAVRWWRAVGAVCAAGALALTLLAYQYLPLAQLVRQSDRGIGLTSIELMAYTVAPGNLYNLVIPTPFPDPAGPFFLTSYWEGGLPFYLDLYWGLPVMALALSAVARRRKQARAVDCSALVPELPARAASDANREATFGEPGQRHGRTAALALLIGLLGCLLATGDQTPVFRWVTDAVPLLNKFRFPAKYFLLPAFGWSLAAALGFDGLLAGGAECSRWFKRLLEAGSAVVGLLAAHVLVNGEAWPRLFLADAGQGLQGDLQAFFGLLRTGWLSQLGFVLGLVAGARTLVFLIDRGKLTRPAGVVALGVLLVADLATTTYRGFPVAPDEAVTLPSSALRSMTRDGPGQPPLRFMTRSARAAFSVDYTVYHHLAAEKLLMLGLRGMSWNCNSMMGCLSVRTQAETELGHLLRLASRDVRDRVVASCGARYLLRAEEPGEEGGGRVIDRVGPVAVRELDSVSPRAFLARKALSSRAAALPSTAALLALPDEALFEPLEGAAAVEERVPASIRG